MRTVIIATTVTRARHIAEQRGLRPLSRDVVLCGVRSALERLHGYSLDSTDTVLVDRDVDLSPEAWAQLTICTLATGVDLDDLVVWHDDRRVTAAHAGPALRLVGGRVTASTTTRQLGGVVLRYGDVGRTNRGPLRVLPGALRLPADLADVKLTREHDRSSSRGHLVAWEDDGTQIRASFRVSDGPEGDVALVEASDRTRDGLSYDVIDAVIEGDTITSARVIAVGQVGIPAYDHMRIDHIAASTPGDTMLTEQLLARLAELQLLETPTDDEKAELDALLALAALYPTPAPETAPEPVLADATTASTPNEPTPRPAPARRSPAVPTGIPAPAPRPTSSTTTQQRPGYAFATFVREMTQAMRGSGPARHVAVSAALADITHSQHTHIIEPPAWSGELWSGLVYEPEFSDLFTPGELTNWEGIGWRFTNKLEMKDWAGDKTEIPTSTVGTEPSGYEAARAAVGVDVDRKFFDFPNEGFVSGLFEQFREGWEILRDDKHRAYIVAQAVPAETYSAAGVANGTLAAQPSLLKAAAAGMRALKRRRVGKGNWVLVNDDDLFTLLDINEHSLPTFLDLWGVEPRDFRSSMRIPKGSVYVGKREAATSRVLPGSPIRVEAQNLTRGGIDEAAFGYWAIEEHHTSGIARTTFTAPVAA